MDQTIATSPPCSPRVTVLMPVYNGARFLNDAIESILCQSFTDFEFLILDDASTDNSGDIIRSYSDRRIRLIANQQNQGVAATLNTGLDVARGEYIARMDCDDISLRDRLHEQAAFLDRHRDISICGSWCRPIGTPGGRAWRYPTDPDEIRCSLLFESVLAHPTVMLRKDSLASSALSYPQTFPHAEDYALWVRAAEKGLKFANIPHVLLQYRTHPLQNGSFHSEVQVSSADRVRLIQLAGLGVSVSTEEQQLHRDISMWRFLPGDSFVHDAEAWLMKLRDANDRTGVYNTDAFSRVIAKRWFAVCMGVAKQRPKALRAYFRSPLRDDTLEHLFKFLLASLAS